MNERWDLISERQRRVNPSLDEVIASVESMDGHKRSVCVLISNSCAMNISGGTNDKVVVDVEFNSDSFFYMLIDTENLKQTAWIIFLIQGTETEFEPYRVVPKAWAISAVQHFYKTKELLKDLTWVESSKRKLLWTPPKEPVRP